jgi:hypothetical protein
MSIEARETIFAWPDRVKSSWRLAGLIFAMLFLHSAAFFLFQAATPVINPPPRTAPPVQLLTAFTPDGRLSPENQSLLRWIEAEDPALVARIPNVEMPALPSVPYHASFLKIRTPPLAAPPEPVTVQFPPARDALSFIMSSAPAAKQMQETVKSQATRIVFSANLASRASASLTFQPKARTAKPMEPATFIVGVSNTGDVRFVFPQQEPADSAATTLAAEAMDFIGGLTFAQDSENPIMWGSATVQWGDDIAEEP